MEIKSFNIDNNNHNLVNVLPAINKLYDTLST